MTEWVHLAALWRGLSTTRTTSPCVELTARRCGGARTSRKLNALAFGAVSKGDEDTFNAYKMRVGKFFGVDRNHWELHSESSPQCKSCES